MKAGIGLTRNSSRLCSKIEEGSPKPARSLKAIVCFQGRGYGRRAGDNDLCEGHIAAGPLGGRHRK